MIESLWRIIAIDLGRDDLCLLSSTRSDNDLGIVCETDGGITSGFDRVCTASQRWPGKASGGDGPTEKRTSVLLLPTQTQMIWFGAAART